jgi:hypothetical protein
VRDGLERVAVFEREGGSGGDAYFAAGTRFDDRRRLSRLSGIIRKADSFPIPSQKHLTHSKKMHAVKFIRPRLIDLIQQVLTEIGIAVAHENELEPRVYGVLLGSTFKTRRFLHALQGCISRVPPPRVLPPDVYTYDSDFLHVTPAAIRT